MGRLVNVRPVSWCATVVVPSKEAKSNFKTLQFGNTLVPNRRLRLCPFLLESWQSIFHVHNTLVGFLPFQFILVFLACIRVAVSIILTFAADSSVGVQGLFGMYKRIGLTNQTQPFIIPLVNTDQCQKTVDRCFVVW